MLRRIALIVAVAASCSIGFHLREACAQQGTYILSGTVSGKAYNRTYNPMRFVAQGQFKFTVVATKYTYKNGVLTIHDGQIWMNGPVSAVFHGASGSFGPRGGKVSSRQTSYRNGMVNQVTISASNAGPSLRITAWNVAYNQYVAPR